MFRDVPRIIRASSNYFINKSTHFIAVNCNSFKAMERGKRKASTKRVVKEKSKKQKTVPADIIVAADVSSVQDKGCVTPVVPGISGAMSAKLLYAFYDVSCEDLAQSLLGQRVVRMVDGKRISGIIVETEAYLGGVDKAAHSYDGKRTPKNEAMFMAPGTAYVYNIYGMYCCLNISSKGDGAAVLLRALQPIENLPIMAKLRNKNKPENMLKKDGKDLCNGPSKLCQALSIKKEPVNKLDMCTSVDIWLEMGDKVDVDKIVKCKRINIDYAKDWVDKPLRFYFKGNPFVSVRDKVAEK